MEMNIFLGYTSALEFWRCYGWRTAVLPSRSTPKESESPSSKTAQAIAEEFPDLSRPLHFIVPSKNEIRHNSIAAYHATGNSFPERSFVKIRPGLMASSPEACFTQMATRCDLIELLEIGYELCGDYSLIPNGARSQGISPQNPNLLNPRCGTFHSTLLAREALTTGRRIRSYLETLGRCNGKEKALVAMQYLLDGSASPMETKMALLFLLPTRRGGYGFPKPVLNYELEVPYPDGHPFYGRHYRVDLCWPDKKLALEYDSHQYHSELSKMELDSRRRIAIETAGFRVISVTKQQLYSHAAFSELADVVAGYLKLRQRTKRKDIEALRLALRRKLGLGF